MQSPDFESRVAAKVREERERRGWKQSELAERITSHGVAIHSTGVTRLEQGKRGISLDEFCVLAAVFGVSPDEWIAELIAEANFVGALDDAMPSGVSREYRNALAALAAVRTTADMMDLVVQDIRGLIAENDDEMTPIGPKSSIEEVELEPLDEHPAPADIVDTVKSETRHAE